MPSSFTHACFALDIYKKLNQNTQDKLKDYKDYFITFNHGPDFFYFSPKKIHKKLGYDIHKTKTKIFFINMIKYIKENQLGNNMEIISFLYGFICHYVADSTIHPFVYYKTGVFNKQKPKTYKYSGKHMEMETFIDLYLIDKNKNIKSSYFKVYKYCFKTKQLSQPLKKMIDSTISKTFDKNSTGEVYMNSIKRMIFFFWFYRYDPYGIKKRLYQIVDTISPRYFVKKTPLSYNMNLDKYTHYLNLEKKEWNHPVDINEKYNYSFFDLYEIAQQEALKIINATNKVIYNNYEINYLDKYLLNKSYITGKDAAMNLKMKYFEK